MREIHECSTEKMLDNVLDNDSMVKHRAMAIPYYLRYRCRGNETATSTP